MDELVDGLIGFAILAVYLVPVIIAFKRHLTPRWMIAGITILAGWTIFGWLIAMVGCYCGLHTSGGTVGVGRATTRAVVIASIAILISDFFLTKAMLVL